MTFTNPGSSVKTSAFRAFRRSLGLTSLILGCAGVIVMLAGCESSSPAMSGRRPESAATRATVPVAVKTPEMAAPPNDTTNKPGEVDVVMIKEGDVLKISFPGAPALDISQQVRADGVVTLDILGEVKVTGQTPKELEKTLSQLFSSQLVSNEVVVAILSSSFDVYVTGAVLRPGKISSTKPITAFQAIMEAGYDPINSNLEKVTLIRQVGREKYSYIPLNLQLVMEGKETTPFYLKPSDTLQVPKKITIF